MDVNRSGYYKWLSRKGALTCYEQNRITLTEKLQKEHEKHKVMGYHALARNVRKTSNFAFSDNLAHKCCKATGIRSSARKRRYQKPGDESLKYENLVQGH